MTAIERNERDPDEPVNILYLSHEEYDWLLTRLDEPPKELPRLRELLKSHREGYPDV
jgi:uncharacterized protein (DUF1778 family)